MNKIHRSVLIAVLFVASTTLVFKGGTAKADVPIVSATVVCDCVTSNSQTCLSYWEGNTGIPVTTTRNMMSSCNNKDVYTVTNEGIFAYGNIDSATGMLLYGDSPTLEIVMLPEYQVRIEKSKAPAPWDILSVYIEDPFDYLYKPTKIGLDSGVTCKYGNKLGTLHFTGTVRINLSIPPIGHSFYGSGGGDGGVATGIGGGSVTDVQNYSCY
jgi:hypothetical protein